jgi:hypothetical protein
VKGTLVSPPKHGDECQESLALAGAAGVRGRAGEELDAEACSVGHVTADERAGRFCRPLALASASLESLAVTPSSGLRGVDEPDQVPGSGRR